MTLRLPRLHTPARLGIFLLCLKVCLRCSTIFYPGAAADDLLAACGAGFLLLALAARHYTPKSALVCAALLGTALYTAWRAQNFTVLITVLSGLAMYREEPAAVLDILFKTETAFLAIQLGAACLLAVTADFSLGRAFPGAGMRYAFGFTHPNLLSLFLCNLILIWCYRNYARLRLHHYAAVVLLCGTIFLLTKTRTALLAEALFVLLLIWQKKHRKSRWLSAAAAVLPAALCLLTAVTAALYTKSSFLLQLDSWLSGRIKLAAYAYDHYGLTVLGQDLTGRTVQWDPVWRLNAHTFDNAYAFLGIQLGSVWLLILLAGAVWLGLRGPKKALPFFILWAFYGFTEVNALNAYLLFPVLLPVLRAEEETEPAAGQIRQKERIPC